MIFISPPIKRLGPWEVKAKDTIYQAATDGYVCACGTAAGATPIVIYADDFTPPTTMRQRDTVGQAYAPYYSAVGVMIGKDEYWKVEDADNVFWRAIF